MKKLTYILAAALTMLAYSACKDDDDPKDNPGTDDTTPSVVSIDQGLLDAGITVSKNSNIAELPINCDGEWHITMAKETDWAQILEWQVKYEGKQTLSIVIDENNTGAARSTTLKVSDSEGNTQTITLHQVGQSDSNGSGETFAGQGLGTGIDYDYVLNTKAIATRLQSGAEPMTFEPTKVHKLNNIFNITAIQALQKKGTYPLKASAYVESPIKMADMQAQLFDSSVVQKKTLSVELTLDLQFGPIEFSASGSYLSTKDESRAKINYVIERYVPMYNVYLSPAELGSYADMHGADDEENLDAQFEEIDRLISRYITINKKKKVAVGSDGLTDAQREEIDEMYDALTYANDFAGIYSTNFTKRLNELYTALAVKSKTKTPNVDKATTILKAIDADYGPFFIAGGDFGGSLAMNCIIDTMYLEGAAKLSGELAGGVGGMFEVHGKFQYDEDGTNLLRDSDLDLHIYGGNANETADRMMAAVTGGSATDLHQWQYIMQDWITSMWSESGDNPIQSQAAPISYTIAPIWEAIENTTVKQFAKDFFIKEYQSRNIELYFGYMNGEYKLSAYDLLNQ